MKKYLAFATALLLAGISTQAQVSQWVAYNDHFVGPLSGANATFYNIFANGAPAAGLLKNSANGSSLTVTLSVTNVVTGVTGGTTSSGPSAGSPASLIFTNQVDFGNANSNHAIQLAASAKIVHTFSGLDPARRYSWHGTAVRGGGYSDRWTLLEISAASWQDAHSTTATGLFTMVSSPNIASLTSSQAVANFGENRLLGTYASWTNIQPNPDGTILIYQSSYHGTMPGTFTSGGTYGYAVVADRLEEFTIGPSTCVAITNQSGNISVPERGAALFSITATGTPQTIQWYRSNDVTGFQAISGANGSSYSIPSVAYPGDDNTYYRATVSNTVCNVTSTAKRLTVIPDSIPPTIVRVIGNPGLDTVTITFSEDILASGVDPANFIIWPTGADPDADYLLTTGAVLNNGSNVVITTDLRISGTNYSLRVSEIRDNSSQQNVIDPNPTDIQFITQDVLLVDFDDNNVWKFGTLSNSVVDATYNPATEFSIPAGWETVGYDDSAWPEGPAGLGLDASVNGVPILTPTGYSARSEPTFFRRHFTLPALTNGLILNMRHVFEDGAVVYINGVDTYRFNVAAATDVNNPASRSAAAAVDPTPITGPISLSLSNVHAGDNVIAVAVIQSGATSSDIEMALELTAIIPQYPAGAVVINTQPAASTTVNEGSSFTLGVGASGSIPITYQWKKGGVDLPGENNPIYHVASALPSHQATYTVAVTNSFGGLISANASVTVVADTIAPVILSAIGSNDQSVVTVTLYDATGINLAQAQTPGNYNIHLTAGGGTLTCTSAVAVVSGTNLVVTLMTDSPRAAGQNYTVTISNVHDTSAAQNLLSPNSRAITATVIIFPFAQVWRYEQTGADLGTAWRASGFNDSAWPSGAGILGFETTAATLTFFTNLAGGSGTNTVLSLTNDTGGGIGGTNVTIYFRTATGPLTFDPNLAGNSIVARSYIDDGAAIYVNGAESMRFNLTNTANYTNFAVANLAEAVLVVSNLTGFVQGNNVIAVEVHQDSLASSDIDWGMQLEALVTTFGAVGPTLHITRNEITGAVTVSWSGGGTLRSTTSLQNAGTVWTPVGGNPNPYTFTPLPGEPAKFFSLAP